MAARGVGWAPGHASSAEVAGRISNHYVSRIAGNNGIGGGYRGGAETAAGRVEIHRGMIFFPTGLSGNCECSPMLIARLAGCFGLLVDRQGTMRS